MKVSNLEYLVDFLRVHIGDTGGSPTYSDETLHNTLRYAVMSLAARWHSKYYLTSDGVVIRNPTEIFDFSSPPVIQVPDTRPIILMASIIIKGGNKNSQAGNTISFRDDEISYSNLEASRQTSSSLQDDINELNNLFGKKLARAFYDSLVGWPQQY